MKIAGPTTTITDYILAAENVVLAILLIRNGWSTGQTSVKLWGFSFFALAVAAVAGGTYHGFIHSMGPLQSQAVWKITLYSIGVTTFLMLSAVFLVALPHPWRNIFVGLAVLQWIVYSIWMTTHDDFKYVIYSYAPAMLIILATGVAGYYTGSVQGGLWLAGAVLVSFAGALVQQSGLSLHRNFNYNDIYHVIQMIAMLLFYRGGLTLRQ